MSKEFDSCILHKLDDGYQITRLEGEYCTLILRDRKQKIVAILDACSHKVNHLNPYHGHVLTSKEKHILHKFIRAYKFSLTKEVAIALDLSILTLGEGEEEYLSERQAAKKLRERFDNLQLYIGKLKMRTFRIPAYSKGGILDLTHAEIKKLIIEKDCDLLVNLADNQTIDALRIQESFTGSINMSRNTVESIEMGNNSRCDLTVNDSLRCFNLTIADVFSGNLNLRNSCFHALKIGYYCYANIKLTQNWGRRGISIGDSFRGNMLIDSVNVHQVKVGKDCKGKITVSSRGENLGNREINVGEEFAGILDLRGAQTVEQLKIGQHARGKVNLLGCPGIKVVQFDKYFSGYVDFSGSSVEYVNAGYGSSGEMVFLQCDDLALLQLPKEKASSITIKKDPLQVHTDDESLYYHYSDKAAFYHYFKPLMSRVYNGISNIFHS